jgi:hypothetical protein
MAARMAAPHTRTALVVSKRIQRTRKRLDLMAKTDMERKTSQASVTTLTIIMKRERIGKITSRIWLLEEMKKLLLPCLLEGARQVPVLV